MTDRVFIKICRNAERFWCEVVGSGEDGSFRARVDNDTLPSNPQYNEIIDIPADEWLYDRISVAVH